MPWLVLLHIATLICWCAMLLYLPPAIFASRRGVAGYLSLLPGHMLINRSLFTGVATPTALLAIGSGTALFVKDSTTELWLIFKLTVVVVLVACHVLCGVLILRLETNADPRIGFFCAALTAVSTLAIGIILWLVLARPSPDWGLQ